MKKRFLTVGIAQAKIFQIDTVKSTLSIQPTSQDLANNHALFDKIIHEFHHNFFDSNNEIVQSLTEFQILIVQDNLLHDSVHHHIDQGLSIKLAIEKAFEPYLDQIKKTPSSYLSLRYEDLMDIKEQLILNTNQQANKIDLDEPVILVGKSIKPSDILRADTRLIKGIITEEIDSLSHVVILANALGIPLLKSPIETFLHQNFVYLNSYKNQVLLLNDASSKTTIAKDIIPSNIPCVDMNIHHPICNQLFMTLNQISPDFTCNNMNIGLIRTEFLFKSWAEIASIDTQKSIYQVFFAIANHRITFRLFDFALDKVNLLDVILKPSRLQKAIDMQIQSLIMAADGRNFHLLIPRVSSAKDVIAVKDAVQYYIEYYHSKSSVQIGAMVETMSAVENIYDIIQVTDFVSIGTNDLLREYITLQHKIRDKSDWMLDPNFLKIMKYIVNESMKQNQEVIACGLMASDPILLPILCGLGIKKFSVDVRVLNEVFNQLAQINENSVTMMSNDVLEMTSITAVKRYLERQGIIHEKQKNES